LTCQLHGWKFDLASGRCLTSVGHEIRSRPADRTDNVADTAAEPATVGADLEAAATETAQQT
jgi:UDP-MurNAc hydroxylase